MPGDWKLDNSQTKPRLTLNAGSMFALTVSTNVPITRFELVEGWESRHYLEKSPVPVLEIEIQQAGTLTTNLHWST